MWNDLLAFTSYKPVWARVMISEIISFLCFILKTFVSRVSGTVVCTWLQWITEYCRLAPCEEILWAKQGCNNAQNEKSCASEVQKDLFTALCATQTNICFSSIRRRNSLGFCWLKPGAEMEDGRFGMPAFILHEAKVWLHLTALPAQWNRRQRKKAASVRNRRSLDWFPLTR